MEGTVLRAGWATKEGGRVPSWKRRYFVLRTRIPGDQLNLIPGAALATHVLLCESEARLSLHYPIPGCLKLTGASHVGVGTLTGTGRGRAAHAPELPPPRAPSRSPAWPG